MLMSRMWTKISKQAKAKEEEVYSTAVPGLFQRPPHLHAPVASPGLRPGRKSRKILIN